MLEIPFEGQSVCIHLQEMLFNKFVLKTKQSYEILKVYLQKWLEENEHLQEDLYQEYLKKRNESVLNKSQFCPQRKDTPNVYDIPSKPKFELNNYKFPDTKQNQLRRENTPINDDIQIDNANTFTQYINKKKSFSEERSNSEEKSSPNNKLKIEQKNLHINLSPFNKKSFSKSSRDISRKNSPFAKNNQEGSNSPFSRYKKNTSKQSQSKDSSPNDESDPNTEEPISGLDSPVSPQYNILKSPCVVKANNVVKTHNNAMNGYTINILKEKDADDIVKKVSTSAEKKMGNDNFKFEDDFDAKAKTPACRLGIVKNNLVAKERVIRTEVASFTNFAKKVADNEKLEDCWEMTSIDGKKEINGKIKGFASKKWVRKDSDETEDTQSNLSLNDSMATYQNYKPKANFHYNYEEQKKKSNKEVKKKMSSNKNIYNSREIKAHRPSLLYPTT